MSNKVIDFQQRKKIKDAQEELKALKIKIEIILKKINNIYKEGNLDEYRNMMPLLQEEKKKLFKREKELIDFLNKNKKK